MLGEVIQRYRKAAKLTQPELCEMLHVHQTHISKIEKGERKPSLDLLSQLAWALRIPAEELIDDADDFDANRPLRVGELRPVVPVPQAPPPWDREKELVKVVRTLEEERKLKVLNYAQEQLELNALHRRKNKKRQ